MDTKDTQRLIKLDGVIEALTEAYSTGNLETLWDTFERMVVDD